MYISLYVTKKMFAITPESGHQMESSKIDLLV
jgi:hypothetical protein